jgi:methylated-DNA-[protein]-cysteine S-methyltransferase
MITYAVIPTPLGHLTAVAQNGAVTHLLLPDAPLSIPADATSGNDPALEALSQWLRRYFAGEHPAIQFPINPRGTPFQRRVWDQLLHIPYGNSVSYASIARALNKPGAAQAIGQAVGANPIPIVIPCHRVLGVRGQLTGYAGGLAAKRYLLDLERISYR